MLVQDWIMGTTQCWRLVRTEILSSLTGKFDRKSPKRFVAVSQMTRISWFSLCKQVRGIFCHSADGTRCQTDV